MCCSLDHNMNSGRLRFSMASPRIFYETLFREAPPTFPEHKRFHSHPARSMTSFEMDPHYVSSGFFSKTSSLLFVCLFIAKKESDEKRSACFLQASKRTTAPKEWAGKAMSPDFVEEHVTLVRC